MCDAYVCMYVKMHVSIYIRVSVRVHTRKSGIFRRELVGQREVKDMGCGVLQCAVLCCSVLQRNESHGYWVAAICLRAHV